jgi:hypothetical protein
MKKILILSVMIGLLSGCTTGTIISNEGTTKNPKWHKIDAVTFNKDKGTFPNIQSLEKVTKGMTKDQLYYLIGRPQYDGIIYSTLIHLDKVKMISVPASLKFCLIKICWQVVFTGIR